MKTCFSYRLGGVLFGVLFFAIAHSFAFQITEKAGEVSSPPAVAGTQTVETGVDGRAQLDLGNGVLRLGANSVLQSDSKKPASLLKGTAVFDFSKQGQLQLQQGGKVFVSGGAGFVRLAVNESDSGHALLVGALAGKVKVTIGGRSQRLQPGELLALDTDGRHLTSNFNLPKLVESASLLQNFRSDLPNAGGIQHEVKKFASLQRRGFVRPVKDMNAPKLLADQTLSVPGAEMFTLVRGADIASTINPIGGGSVGSGGGIILTGGSITGNDGGLDSIFGGGSVIISGNTGVELSSGGAVINSGSIIGLPPLPPTPVTPNP